MAPRPDPVPTQVLAGAEEAPVGRVVPATAAPSATARPAAARIGHRRGESGQALVEFVLVLPLVALLMGVAFTGWNAMQLSVRLTSAARAGAIQAAADLASGDSQAQAATDATTAVNNEEGVSGVYQDSDPAAADYVSVSQPTSQTVSGTSGTTTINVVTVTISRTADTLVPFVGNIAVNTHATARFS